MPSVTIDRFSLSVPATDRWFRSRRLRLLEEISFSAPAGEVTSIIGASGAGKSLLARALVGLVPPGAEVDGRLGLGSDLTTLPVRRPDLLARIGYIPQGSLCLDPCAPVGRQARWAAADAGHADPSRVAREALRLEGLAEGDHRLFPHQLSGGMGRRAVAALADPAQSPVVIADEPTVGLDPESRDAMLRRLKGLADQGRTVLIISHDLAAITRWADSVVVLDAGRVVEQCETNRLTAGDARTAFARALWAALPQNGFLLPEEIPQRHAAE